MHTPRFRVERVAQQTPDGQRLERAVVRHPGAVVVVPMVDDRHVCLIHNFRIAVQRTLIELPAGTLEPNEPPLETARRELLEETGYAAGRLTPLHAFFLSPGILDERMYAFVAEDLQFQATAREAGEQIENLVVRWDEAIRMVLAGEIEDAKSIASLLLLNARRPG